jgi:sugar/nucleoside kinase (ribokinase family)
MGIRASILTIAAPDAELSALDGHDVHVVPSESTLTFEHRVIGGVRELRLLERALPSGGLRQAVAKFVLSPSDVPAPWRGASEVILAPLTEDDIDVDAFVTAFSRARVWLLAQGLQRRAGEDGGVHSLPHPAEALVRALSPGSSLFLSTDETAPWPSTDLDAVLSRCERLVITRGSDGATVLRAGGRIDMPAMAAKVVDTTGAGDVFATAFILGVSKLGLDDRGAGALASAFAAASVERTGPVPLPPLSEVRRRFGVAVGGLCACA